jgi:hypothetical protein
MFAGANVGLAQDTGVISGKVTEASGKAIPDATVRIIGSTGFKIRTTDAEGNYSAEELAAGTYDVTVSKPGFKDFKANDIALSSGQARKLDAILEPAVEATPVPVNTEHPPSSGPAQEIGTISGTVTDSSGAVVPKATVSIRSSSGLKNLTTDDEGNYSVAGMTPGAYDVTISKPGFKDFNARARVLATGQSLRVDAKLEPAGEVTSVTVQGQQAANVETQTAQLTGTITRSEITSLGLNGRNFTQLIALAPGVSNQTGQDEALVGVKGSVKYSVNGGRVEYNTFDVDGSDVLNAGINGSQSTLIVFPSLDAIGSLKVLTSNYGAIYGRSASGTVLVTTKSGADKFHGDAYEFVRNEMWNARNFFDQTHGAPLYRRNDFGFTLGGPIVIPHILKKGSSYFFYSEEVRREKTPQDFNQGVPSTAERQGDFNDVCPFPGPQGVLFSRSAFPDCPAEGITSGAAITYPGNRLLLIDSNAIALLNAGVIPAPDSSTGCTSSINSCYDVVVSPPTNWREELFRIDHNITPSTRATFRYIHDAWDTVNTTPIWGFVQNSFPNVENRFVGPGVSMVGHVTRTVTSWVNDVVLSYTTDHISLTDVDGVGGQWQRPSGLTMGYLFNNGFGGKMPGIVIGGTNAAYGGYGFATDPSFEPWNHSNPTITIRDDVGKVMGQHTLNFGAHIVLAQKNEVNYASAAATGDLQGIVSFSNVNSLETTGNAFADFLTGGIRAFQQDSATSKYYERYRTLEPYFQDDWRLNPHLTLNLGLRLSIYGRWYDKNPNVSSWVPAAYNGSQALAVNPTFGYLEDPATQQPVPLNPADLDPRVINGLVQCGRNGVSSSCMARPQGLSLINPAPRLGFAWDPRGDGRTAIRVGYGIFYHHGTGNEANVGSLEGSAPVVLSMTQNFHAIGYPCIGGVGPGCPAAGASAYPLNLTAIPTVTVWPYVQQWSLSVQQSLSSITVLTVAYVGSKGTHLTAERQLNQLPPVDPSRNPFAPGQPITTSVCDTFTGSSFSINGSPLFASDPGFINLEAACYGTAGTLGQFPDPNALRQFAPGIGEIFSLENVANSSYEAIQMTLRRTVGRLNLDISYSLSQSRDDSSDRFDSTLVNSYNLRSNYAASNFDQRHLLSASYVYLLPSLARLARSLVFIPQTNGTQKPSRFMSKLMDDWELSGVTIFQTGTPFSVINGGSAASGVSVLDNAGVANGIGAGSYPDVIGFPNTPPPQGSNNSRSFGPILGNPNAFAAPQGLTFGDAGRNFMRNPSRTNFDMALLKHFKIKESVTFELRGEAFNVFNHTQFRIYNPDRGNTASNTISCYGGPNNLAGFVSASSGGSDCLMGNGFLHPVDAHRPRTIQFGAKLLF